MEENDTIKLLQECNSGSKMAVTSIDEILEKVQNPDLKAVLMDNKEQHKKLGNEIHAALLKLGASEKEPNLLAKGMAWMKTNMKAAMEDGDKAAADLITDGCGMGIKSLHQYENQYINADAEAKKLCNQLIEIEEKLRKELQKYL